MKFNHIEEIITIKFLVTSKYCAVKTASIARRHSEKLPDLEKRARLLSAEYREVQKSRPIDVVAVAGD